MHRIVIIYFFLSAIGGLQSQQINWVTWEEAIELSNDEPKKIFVDVYTEWCGYCEKLDKTTLSNPVIVEYINATYYAIKFDAEYKSDIELNGKNYQFVNGGKRGYHELAKEILNGQMSYPTLVFLDEGFLKIQPIKGFQDVTTMHQILHYFGGDHHKDTPWMKFTQNFNSHYEQKRVFQVKN